MPAEDRRPGRRFRRWMLENRVEKIEGPHEHREDREAEHLFWKVM